MFRSASKDAHAEFGRRKNMTSKILSFGIDFLNDALRGIFPDDLVLLGAPSGVGKTQICCNIALSNLEAGRKIHYIALEAGEDEIERRMKYPHVCERYYSYSSAPRLGKLNYTDWLMGKYAEPLEAIEIEVSDFFHKAYRDLFLFYKQEKFGLTQLIESVCYAAGDTDLIIIDHVHYFDFEDDNENRAIKEIAKTVRNLVLDNGRPIILVAHLRKRDRHNDELVAGMEEFHGSSDLFKIATKVITVAPGPLRSDGTFETYFRIPKNRLDQGVARYCGKEIFDPKRGGYVSGKYEIGRANQSRTKDFEQVPDALYPDWGRTREYAGGRGDHDHLSEGRKPWYAAN